ncbi:MAG: hypothetical protein AAF222_12070 [Pseudomonadota bacterium]
MDADDKTLTIVYQFGKVASTSLVKTLQTNAALDVHQSHFLGESALQRIVPIAVDKATNAYFQGHLSGQLLSNLELTYRMNRVLGGEGDARLKVISLSREPLDWLRSGILQDMVGYRPDLLAFGTAQGAPQGDEDDALCWALEAVMSRIIEVIEIKGGFPNVIAEFNEKGGRGMLSPIGVDLAPIVHKLFFLALRPHTWFEEHFRLCFGFGPEAFDARDGIWVLHQPRADFAILRYEDLETRVNDAFGLLKLGVKGPLLRENVSRSKPGSDVVRAAFSAPVADALRCHLRSSDYAEHFGYGRAVEWPKDAAE